MSECSEEAHDHGDVRIEQDGKHLYYLHNGLFGPATDVFHAVRDLAEQGVATRTWGIVELDVSLSGRDLRSVLEGHVSSGDFPDAERQKYIAMVDGIRDDSRYQVSAFEY